MNEETARAPRSTTERGQIEVNTQSLAEQQTLTILLPRTEGVDPFESARSQLDQSKARRRHARRTGVEVTRRRWTR